MIGWAPVQLPFVVESLAPTTAEPVIAGSPVLTGPVWSTTMLVASEKGAAAVPSEFEAVTCTRRRDPTSAATSVYVAPVAPAIASHPEPELLQRCHWNAKLIGGVPSQLPVPATSVWPLTAGPEIEGGDVLFGAAWGSAPPLSGSSRAVSAAEAMAVAATSGVRCQRACALPLERAVFIGPNLRLQPPVPGDWGCAPRVAEEVFLERKVTHQVTVWRPHERRGPSCGRVVQGP